MFSFLNRKNLSADSLRNEVLSAVTPLTGGDLRIEDVRISKDGTAIISLLTVGDGQNAEARRAAVEQKAKSVKGIVKALAVLTGNERPAALTAPKNPSARQGHKDNQYRHDNLPPVVIAVASGKGGVGKSTVAVNLAAALSRLGKKVGILDADIYGPSLPRLLGVKDASVVKNEKDLLEPVVAHGLRVMSMGFMVDEKSPMIWRGPVVQSALLQMIRDVDWSGVDVLLIDMPPGTGDIHLTVAQRIPLSGGVVVSTPQDIALIDARKGLEMFRKVDVSILGIVENMSVFCCPQCGHREPIFGEGGAKAEAETLGVPFLGALPLRRSIREFSDAGTPIVFAAPDGDEARDYLAIAERVLENVTIASFPAPLIRMED